MNPTLLTAFVLIAVTVVVSRKGFSNQAFLDGYKFEVDKVLIGRDYKRLLTSGFLHIDWTHLLLNMLSLYLFSSSLAAVLSPFPFLLIYFLSLAGGDLLALFVHRHHGDYSSVGASSAVSGLIFAAIALLPGMQLGFFGLYIPAWLYGAVYVFVSIYAVRYRQDNIGHEAHLGGALTGMLVALALSPQVFRTNYPVILLLTLPTLVFIWLLYRNPALLLLKSGTPGRQQYSIDQRYNAERTSRQQDVDRILDKIHRRGMNSLTKAERDLLHEHSERI